MTMASLAAFYVVACGFAIVSLFQLALALGAPWGSLAMGGRFPGRYPPAMRVVCLFMIALYAVMALVLAARVELAMPQWFALSRTLTWVIVVIMALGVVGNLATRSVWERRIWAPVAIVLLVCSVVIALR